MEEPNSEKGAQSSAPPSTDTADVAPGERNEQTTSPAKDNSNDLKQNIIVRSARPSRLLRLIVFAVLAALLVGGILFFQRRETGKAKAERPNAGPAGVMITTATSRQGDIGVYVSALGSVVPINTVTIKSRVDGQLMSVNYREGQMVHQGDVLAQIDPRPFQAALTQAQGQYDRDKAQLENANIDLNRYQIAYSKNAI